MKYKTAIIYGILSWAIITIISLLLTPYDVNMPHINILMPITIIIVTSFFTILYIRNFDSHEVIEGLKLGIIFIIIDIIGDYFFSLLQINYMIVDFYPTHITLMIILIIIITSFIGYLAQMTIELR